MIMSGRAADEYNHCDVDLWRVERSPESERTFVSAGESRVAVSLSVTCVKTNRCGCRAVAPRATPRATRGSSLETGREHRSYFINLYEYTSLYARANNVNESRDACRLSCPCEQKYTNHFSSRGVTPRDSPPTRAARSISPHSRCSPSLPLPSPPRTCTLVILSSGGWGLRTPNGPPLSLSTQTHVLGSPPPPRSLVVVRRRRATRAAAAV